MILSKNVEPSKKEFESLLDNTKVFLLHEYKASKTIRELEGRKFEPVVKEAMDYKAHNTPFEGTIELVSGQKFPDIIAKKYYGLEVKTTIKDHWSTTGNSVLESTRIDNVERIYLLFAKITSDFDLRIKPYEKCLSEVVVTHSPRYLIDMELKDGQTIFDKIKISYDILRKSENPIKPILKYYKSLLKEGEALWWMDEGVNDDSLNGSKIVMRVWNTLSEDEREQWQCKGFAYFPEVLSNHNDKFSRFSLWLASTDGVICNNVRDIYTAGGQEFLTIKNKKYKVSKIIWHLFNNIINIKSVLLSTSKNDLSVYWEKNVSNDNKIDFWINLIGSYCEENPTIALDGLKIKKALSEMFKAK